MHVFLPALPTIGGPPRRHHCDRGIPCAPSTSSDPTSHSNGTPAGTAVGDVGKMSLEEYLAVKTLCDRLPELPPRVQGDLIKKVWLPVANRPNIALYTNIHPVSLMEAVVMKYAREKGLPQEKPCGITGGTCGDKEASTFYPRGFFHPSTTFP